MTTNDAVQTSTEVLHKLDVRNIEAYPRAMRAVEKAMFDVVNSDVEILRDASQHILRAGGKRIRPRLMMLCYLALGGNDVEHVAPAAAALELVHTASVVHDDINDHGVVRRGRPSVNAIWGRTFALLTGDYLFTKVYELMAPYGPQMNTMFSSATTALVEGETLQASAVKENNLSREVYYQIIARKTAALFRAGAMMGATMADADKNITEALGRFGYNVGLAFQIIDDILDLVGDENQLGKTAGIDVEQGKGLASVQEGSDALAAIRDKANSEDTIAEGRQQAENLLQSALLELEVLPDSEEKAALEDLARLVVERIY